MSGTSNPSLESQSAYALMLAFLQLQSSLSTNKNQQAVAQAIAMELGAELARANAEAARANAAALAAAQAQASQDIASGIVGMATAMSINSHTGASFIRASHPAVSNPSAGSGVIQGQAPNHVQAMGALEAQMKIHEVQQEIVDAMQGHATQGLKDLEKMQEDIAKMLAGLATGHGMSRG